MPQRLLRVVRRATHIPHSTSNNLLFRKIEKCASVDINFYFKWQNPASFFCSQLCTQRSSTSTFCLCSSQWNHNAKKVHRLSLQPDPEAKYVFSINFPCSYIFLFYVISDRVEEEEAKNWKKEKMSFISYLSSSLTAPLQSLTSSVPWKEAIYIEFKVSVGECKRNNLKEILIYVPEAFLEVFPCVINAQVRWVEVKAAREKNLSWNRIGERQKLNGLNDKEAGRNVDKKMKNVFYCHRALRRNEFFLRHLMLPLPARRRPLHTHNKD